ncbi:MAG: ribonuclease P protein component [Prevotellaceae bacterium]|jgi:ribonuclease P protein component|nr:ribonuclease P protein component [Prevotellaceae bacterium]
MENINTFNKKERLCGEVRINELFGKGKAFTVFPFRVVFRRKDKGETPASILISVPKKRIKRANGRNLIKRRIREAYRLNKHSLYATLENRDFSLDFALLYIADERLDYAQIEPKIIEVIQRLNKRLQ